MDSCGHPFVEFRSSAASRRRVYLPLTGEGRGHTRLSESAMGHRALIAYERTDGNYNLHYSHWGGCQLRLKHRITEATPFGGEIPSQWTGEVHDALAAGEDIERLADQYHLSRDIPTDVEPLPRVTDVGFEQLLTDELDFLHHEAFYVVDRDFRVTAYRTLWLGLEYDSELVTDSPTVGHGILKTVRWHDGHPVGDDYTRGQFEAVKRVVGDMVDTGAFDLDGALEYIREQTLEAVGDPTTVRVRRQR